MMQMGSEDPQEVFEREERSHDAHLKAALAFAVVALLVLLGTVVYLLSGNVEEERQEKVQAQVEAEELRDRVLRVCASPGESRKVLTEIGACQRAKQAEKTEPDPEVVTGKDGEPGPMGPRGFVGPRGPEGPRGEPGPEGDTGPQGSPGDLGDMGPPGADGEDGAPGEDGVDGAPGEDGAVGPAGPSGEPGPMGPEGPAGPAGADGEDGADGATGPAGPPGPTGTGIDSMQCTDGYWVVTYTDGTTQTTNATCRTTPGNGEGNGGTNG